ncbi:DUF2225 domain-containing protein [Paenibacillus glycanilyticus]|uniref:DUF2225 domain-containing protein n=1 Tax=Paenibacillus glycanilyticus TaxID=126569 RepID=A0ABQ6GBS4_9BACL|nr:DUF2225 domain-containing protein [Paenibacillus glycanilyticus]GLX67700.1 hypothetical protein MU1_20450 [Paenibacillus glycanilyticus]
MEPLYQTKMNCICCETIFTTSRVRPSFKKAVSIDSDFCGYYHSEANPDYYVVRVCPNCGFATTENGIQKLAERQKNNYREQIGSRWKACDYGGERDAVAAMTVYKLALLSAQAIEEKPRVIAGILHHIAWLYRYDGNQQGEQRFMRFALQAYIKVYEEEESQLNNAKLMYLIGELNRRTGELKEAVKWFSRIVGDKRIMDAAMIRRSREQWQLIREQLNEGQPVAADGEPGDSPVQTTA